MIVKLAARTLLFVLALLVPHSFAWAESRSALVIGNSSYSFGPLLNPENDAKLLAETLEKTGFTVKTVLNADRQTMQKALLDFSRDIRDKDTVGLFYFAGHGAQVAGQNYLIPVDADIKAESEVKIFGINVDEFVATLERADGRTNIVILDSCRNNPFGAAARSARKGLAPIDAPAGTFIAYSTAPGQVALDGSGQNSPYAAALSKAITQPNVSIEQAFKLTRRDVLDATQRSQVPWESSSLTGDFVFTTAEEAVAPVAPVAEATAEPDPAPVAEPDAAPAPEVEAEAVDSPPEQAVAVLDPSAETPAPEAPVLRELTVEPQVFPVGKWPEGLAIADNGIWVAESGKRRIVKIDPAHGDLLQTAAVGRLPVSMAADPDGNVYSAQFTDQDIFKQPPGGESGKTIAVFKQGFLRGMSFGNGALHAVTSTEDNERKTVITRVDPQSFELKASPPFNGDARSFIMAQDSPWLLDTSSTLTIFDKDSLDSVSSSSSEGFMWSLAANLDAVFVGGREQQSEGKSMVQRHAQGNPEDKIVQTLESDELITAMAANNDRVAALGNRGTVWILDAISLAPLKHFNTGRPPQAAVFENGHLFITTHQNEGENGAVLIYSDVGNLD